MSRQYASYETIIKNHIMKFLPEYITAERVVDIKSIPDEDGNQMRVMSLMPTSGNMKDLRRNDERFVAVPMIGLPVFFEMFEEGLPYSVILKDLAEKYIQAVEIAANSHAIAPHGVFTFENIEDMLMFQVVDKTYNEDFVNNHVHTDIAGDLALVYFIDLSEAVSEGARAMVTRDMAEHEGYDLSLLHEKAVENMSNKLSPLFARLPENPLVPTATNEAYALTNNLHQFGSSCLFYPNMLEEMADILKDDYYIILLNVHETVIAPVSRSLPAEHHERMLRRINGLGINDPSEIVTNTLFMYERGKGITALNNNKNGHKE